MYPSNDIIYIDFEYKGIPKNLNINSIQLIEKPGTKSKDLEEDGIEFEEIITKTEQ